LSAIDLRSDTVTKPTEAMLDRMRHAEVGDDSRDRDPTVRALEALGAQKTGKEAALFVPSGTMANLVALLTHAVPGGEVLLSEGAHILRSEMGGIAAIAGLPHRAIPAPRGAMDVDRLSEAVHRELTGRQLATGLICMETTHNAAGGTVLPLPHMAAVYGLAKTHGIPVHTDGARLFNAAVALGVDAARIAAHTDTICFCVSKGLSAPVGSLLAGPAAFIARARAFRRMVGGNMRQAGVIAAAGIVALEEMVDRLADDHRRARRLAEGIERLYPGSIDLSTVESNMTLMDVRSTGRRPGEWVDALRGHEVLVGPSDATRLRLVTHRHIGDAEIDRALAAFAALRPN
jgi:threonine aldolase